MYFHIFSRLKEIWLFDKDFSYNNHKYSDVVVEEQESWRYNFVSIKTPCDESLLQLIYK